jgi:RHS repeat-associated protein
VTVNQRIMGGQWVLLGSFTLNASTAYSIALSDNPNGQVAADAVRVVPMASSAEKFTWKPTIPSSGSYDVYARWVTSSANTGSATYTVTHAGGSTNVIVNQKQNGGTWVRLGAYSFAPSSGHKVELLGANDGRVVADGIRLVVAGAQAANIAYIHADHLGSTQKMTDTAQSLTWDAQFEPFGEEFLISGSAVQPNRFPGQYADAETGYSYNYFRDYDPAVGRYVQGDPLSWSQLLQTYRGVQLTAPLEPAAMVPGVFELSRQVLNVRLQEELREGGFWDGYKYARNSPVTLIDPTGEQAFGGPGEIDGLLQLCEDSDCEKECTKQYDKDSEKCRKVRNRRIRALCWTAAMAKYGICLAGC